MTKYKRTYYGTKIILSIVYIVMERPGRMRSVRPYRYIYALTLTQNRKTCLEVDGSKIDDSLYDNESYLNVKIININYEVNGKGQLHVHCTVLSTKELYEDDILFNQGQNIKLDRLHYRDDLKKWTSYCQKHDPESHKWEYLQKNTDLFTGNGLPKKLRIRKPH